MSAAPSPASAPFDAIARLALTATGANGGAVAAPGRDGVWQAVGHAGSLQLPLDTGPAHGELLACLAKGLSVRSDDTAHDPRFQALSAAGIRSVAAAPVLLERTPVASIVVCDAEAQRFDARTDDALLDVVEVAAALMAARPPHAASIAGVSTTNDGLAEERWRFALEVSSEGVWDWDLVQDCMYVSPGWCSLLGYENRERPTSGEGWARLIHPDDLAGARALLFAHLRGDSELYSGEYRMRHRDGRWLWMHNRGKVVSRSSSGRALRLVGTLVDTTERRAAEVARQDKHAAEFANHAKNKFLSRMSHEMRTPLNAVIGFSQLLLADEVAREPLRVREYASHALKAGRRLLELIDDVLDLQVLDESGVDGTQANVSLRPLVQRALQSMRGQADAVGVQLACEVPAGVSALGDPDRLLQVVRNLTSNGVKYNRPAGRVTWSAVVEGERVSLIVQDTGSGMSDAQLARLFQPFERLGRENGPIEGTGLGLIIARSSVQRMGGRLTVGSRPGVGTRVTVDLRLASRKPAPAPPAVPPSAPMRLLYVEDNRVNALLFSEALRGVQSIELRLAEDGAEALALVDTWKPDVLVLDSHLPGMNGYEVLQKLRAVPGLEAAPAYMCSADAMSDDLRRARNAGFRGYWTKPIDIGMVLAELQQLATARA